MSKKSRNISETTVIKVGQGSIAGLLINSHTSGTVKIVDGIYNGLQANGVLTSSGASAPADFAFSTLTSDATNVADGETVVVGATGGTSITYRFKTTPAQAYDVKIGTNASETLDNLKKAINATGTAGTEYFAGTLVNPDIIAYTKTATTLKVAFRTRGVAGNAYTTTETSGHLSWTAGTLAGGVAVTGADVVIGGVSYLVVKQLSETLGLPAVANQILWVTSEAVFLDNLKSAINLTGLVGTDYSTGTEQHPTVYATTNTNTAQTVVSKLTGSAQNAIAITTTLANYAWGASTLASGTGATGRIIHNTMTLSVVATTGERFIPLFDEEFYNALLVVLGGTADITVVYDNQ